MINLSAAFEKYDDEYLEFDRIENKLHPRPDICAFILLDSLVPNPGIDIVCSSEHDEFYLDTEPDDLEKVATDADILTLVRCGVRYDEGVGSFAMFA